MTRFGDFTLLEDLGASDTADRYKASHASLGGPFFLKVYSRLDPSLHADLLHRCEVLLGRTHPNLSQHLGHGVVDGLPFVVSPFLEGIDLAELSTSLLDRRVTIGLESVLLVLADLATAVGALHTIPSNNGAPTLSHGDVSVGHVRVGADGQVWLTGLTTPRTEAPGQPPEGRWDLAGVGALVYDLVPLLRGGAQRPPLPAPLDRVVRRALGIGTPDDRIGAPELVDRLGEVSVALKLKPDRPQFAELVRRTVRAVEKRVAEGGSRPVPKAQPAPSPTPSTPPSTGKRSPADAIPSLDPVDRLPTLEPLGKQAPVRAPQPARPAPILELIPVDAVNAADEVATTRLVPGAPARPPSQPPSASASSASLQPSMPSIEPTRPMTPQRPIERASLTDPSRDVIVGRVEPAGVLPQPNTDLRTIAANPPRRATPPPQPSPPAPPTLPNALRPAQSLDDPFAPAPHTDPRMAPSKRSEKPLNEVREAQKPPPFAPFGDLPPDLDTDAPAPLTEPTPSSQPLPAALKRATPPPPLPKPNTAPPIPATKRGAVKRPLLADPDETGVDTTPQAGTPAFAPAPRTGSANPALDERTKDATDPEQRTARAAQARNDPSVRALLRRGVVDEGKLSDAILEHATRGGRVIEILVANKAITDAAVADALAAEANRARVSDDVLRTKPPAPALVRRLPQTYVLARRILPLSFDAGVLRVAVADPFDEPMLEELRNLLGAHKLDVVVAARAALTAATVEAYRQLGIGGVPGTAAGGSTVLLCTADDNKASRIGARLAQEGYHVEHVVNGKIAQDIIANRPPDVVIAAHDLADVNTGALLLFTREQARTAETAFFVFGPRGDEQLMTRLLDLGADDYFSEPVKLEVLLSKVRKATRKGRGGIDDASIPTGFKLPSVDERTPIHQSAPPLPSSPFGAPVATSAPVPTLPPPAQKRSEPTFLENIAMPSLDDLPELPPDFGSADEPAPEPPSMPTGVMGTLRQMALPEIVQSLEMGRKTARVDLVPADGEKGMIAFETGQIRYAECGALRGDDAFYQLARHKEGFFRIHYGDKPPAVNIEHPTTFLLLEAMRRMDEEGQDLS